MRIALPIVTTLLLLAMCCACNRNHPSATPNPQLRTLASLPQPLGGASAAWLGDRLLLIGGNWWTGTPWDGGTKHWERRIFRLDANETWQLAGELPVAVSYAAAIAANGRIYLLGGQDDRAATDAIWRMEENAGALQITASGALPTALVMHAAAIFGNRLFVLGGQTELTSTSVTAKVWSTALADLEAGSPQWKEEAPFPGGARTLPMVAACDASLYVAGGLGFEGQPPQRRYRNDAWRLDADGHWTRIADLPAPRQAGAAACTPAGFLVISGNDGALAGREQELANDDVWFLRDVLRYDAQANAWQPIATLPHGFITAAAATREGKTILAGGEDRPASRTGAVLELSFPPTAP